MMRVDVFSTKGGVGKTTVAYRLARKWAEESKKPVLLIDADLSGTCLGDLVEPEAKRGWREQENLIHLVCGRPEELPELLKSDVWPVYELRSAPDEQPRRASTSISGPQVLFCPSHAETYFPVPGGNVPVDLAVLQALLGHESAGGWVGHVIERVIAVIDNDSSGVGKLAGTVVDHGPGIGALQWSQMSAIDAELAKASKEGRSSRRRALFVASRDLVDLSAAQAVNDRIIADKNHPLKFLRADATWVLNRIPRKSDTGSKEGPDDWRTSLQEILKVSGMGPGPRDAWFLGALPLFEEPLMGDAYAISGLAAYCDKQGDVDIQNVYTRVINTNHPRAAS